jgi:hypothetical protein
VVPLIVSVGGGAPAGSASLPATSTGSCESLMNDDLAMPGQTVFSATTASAVPPIHVWMPNQPQATTARRTAGTFAPRVPNEARAKTGNGMP